MQFLNAPAPIVVTPSGIETDVRLLQSKNISLGMEVIPAGMVTEVRFLHFSKQLLAYEVIELGRSISVNPE